MKVFRILPCLTVLACAFTTSAFAHGPGKQNDFEGRRVLFIGVDGCRADAVVKAMADGYAPHMKALSESGLLSRQIYAGGRKGTPTQQPTVSGPGWSSLLTGVWHDKHHVTNNRFLGARYRSFPYFMRRLEDLKPSAWTASFVDWAEIHKYIADGSRDGGKEFLDEKFTGTADPAKHGMDYPELDTQVRDYALQSLRTRNPDCMFVYFAQVDEYGHGVLDKRSRFSPDNELYLHSIGLVDSYIGELIRSMRARPSFSEEEWLVLITTDHGGRENGHGGDSNEERNIWLIANGCREDIAARLTKPFGQTLVPHIIFQHLGLPSSPDWDIAE